MNNQIPNDLVNKFECVDNFQDADVIIVWDKLPEYLNEKIKDKKKIFIGAEPPHIFNPNNKQIKAIEEARSKILNQYNIWSVINNLTKGI